jgi:hypothetical protein
VARTAVSPVVSAGGPAEPEVNEVDVDENGWCFRRTRFEGSQGGGGRKCFCLRSSVASTAAWVRRCMPSLPSSRET